MIGFARDSWHSSSVRGVPNYMWIVHLSGVNGALCCCGSVGIAYEGFDT